MLRSFLSDFKHNLLAGVRLALLRPLRSFDFRISPGQFIALAVLGALCASLVDLAILGADARWNGAALGEHARDSALLLLLTWIIAAALRAPQVALALPVVLLSAGWLPDVLFATLIAVPGWLGIAKAWQFSPIWWLALTWGVVIAWRSLDVVLAGRRQLSLGGRALVVAAIFGGTLAIAWLLPTPHLWEERTQSVEGPQVTSEEVLAAQPRLLFDALTGLEQREPGITNFYFVGFAGDASQDVFRNDMEAAQEVADEHLGTEGRSLILVNSLRTVLELPLATVSNLRAALSTVGQLIDAEQDVAVVYLSSHGSPDHRLYVNFPPLALQQLTPVVLHRMLQEAGIKWKVIIVSACYSGGYVEPLKDPHTMVITSSRGDRSSFGCDNKSEFTYFGEAFFQGALRKTRSLIEAFGLARAAIEHREKAEGLQPSEPQMFVGEAIGRKLGAKARPTNLAGNAAGSVPTRPASALEVADFAPVFVALGVDR